MCTKRLATLILACIVSVSFYLPGALAQEIEVIDLESRSAVGDYMVGVLEVDGGPFYIDRDYNVASMSEEFEGATYISTAMDDEASTGAGFITFKVNVPVVVWVGTDARQGNPPAWLSPDEGWVERPDMILQSVESDTGFYVLSSKEFPAGEISLGGNFDAPAGLAPMYVVLLTHGSGEAAVEASSKLTTTWARLKSKN